MSGPLWMEAAKLAFLHEGMRRDARAAAAREHRAIVYEDFDSIMVGAPHTARIEGCAECASRGEKEKAK